VRTKPVNDFFVSGGTLPPDSQSYIERASDAILLESLQQGRYCYVLNSRQMGKSSLSVRTMAKLEAQGIRTAFIDLTQIGGRNVTAEQWYMGLVSELGRSLGLRGDLLGYCKHYSDVSPMQRFFGAIREVVLKKIEAPLVIFVDEIDATKNLSFNTDEFFAGIRECFNRRVHDADLNRLTFCLLGVAVPSDLISNPATTPFNIGERIHLQDFTLKELQVFAPALGDSGSKLIQRIHHWTNGQPFLTQSLCATVAAEELKTASEVDAVVFEQFFGPKARDTNINLADVANRALNGGANEAEPEKFRADLLSMYERAWKGGHVKDDEANRVAVVLKLSGLMRSDGTRLKVRNPIYHHVFDQQWIQDSMPEQELRRQEVSYRRGVIRGTTMAAAIVLTISALGIYAWRSRQIAVDAQNKLDYELYVASMGSMRFFEETGDIARMEQVLASTEHSPHRNFEWAFWNARLHDAKEEYTLDYTAPGKREDAILSRDGKYLCLTDALLRTCTVVDRKSKRVLNTFRQTESQWVVSSSRGLLLIDTSSQPNMVSDLVTGKELFRIGGEGHLPNNPVRRYSDYALIAVQDHPNGASIRWELYSLIDGKLLKTCAPYDHAGGQTFLSEDGKIFSFQQWIDGSFTRAISFDLMAGKIVDDVKVAKDTWVYDCTPDGRYTLYREQGNILVGRDTVAHRTMFRMNLSNDEIPTSAFFSSDGKEVVALYTNGSATIFEPISGSKIARRNNVWTISQAGDQPILVLGSSTVRLVPLNESSGARTLTQGQRVAKDGGGSFRIIADADHRIQMLSDPGLELGEQRTLPEGTFSFTYNGRWFMWRRGDGKTHFGGFDRKNEVVFEAEYNNFASGVRCEHMAALDGRTQTVWGLNGTTGERTWSRPFPSGVRGMWISPNSRLLFVMSGETALTVLDPATGHQLGILDAHNVRVTNLTFPNNEVFFTCGADGRSILWDCKTLTQIQQFVGNAVQRISGVDISPDGKRVATSSYAGTWQLWDTATGAQMSDVKDAPGSVRTIVFTSDGKNIVTAGDDKQVKVWTTLQKNPSVRLPIPAEFAKGIKR
jgi:hypothetical protein